MLNRKDVERAVDLQQRSYRLLRWLAEGIVQGFIKFDTAHDYSTFPEAAEEWIAGHYENIPVDARPERGQLSEYCSFFSTYLENSFELVREPGQQLWSECGCTCPWCAYMIDSPNLRTKKLTAADRRRTRKMKASAVRSIAAENSLLISDDAVDSIVDDSDLRETLSLVAYGVDLLSRTRGVAVGPAALALWRGFAWNRQGSPDREFTLTADRILNEERRLREIVLRARSDA